MKKNIFIRLIIDKELATKKIININYNGTGILKTGDNISNPNGMDNITLYPVVIWSLTFNIGSSSITVIKERGSELEGNFNFVGVNGNSSKNFINGKFAMSY